MEDIINLEHVNKGLAGRQILKDVTLAVKQGDIFGYLGPNGAGKTTSIRVILGLFAPDSGNVSILGQNPQSDHVRRKIGFVLETDGLYENMSAYENLAYYGQLYEIPELAQKIDGVTKLVGLADRVQDKVGAYSKGMRQRLALARAVIHDPAVLVLDEPTAGVDPTGQIEIRDIMLDLVHKQGKTILLSSHNLDEVQRICNRISLIHKGEIRISGVLDELQHGMSRGEVTIETTGPIGPAVIAKLNSMADVRVRDQNGKVLSVSVGNSVDVSDIVTFLATSGVKIEQVKKQEATLEEIYTTILKEAEQK